MAPPGDSIFLPGEVVDKFRFRFENERLSKSVVISNAGDTKLKVEQVVLRSEVAEANAAAEVSGGEPAKGRKPSLLPRPPCCWASPRRVFPASPSFPPRLSRRRPRSDGGGPGRGRGRLAWIEGKRDTGALDSGRDRLSSVPEDSSEAPGRADRRSVEQPAEIVGGLSWPG